MHTSLRNGAQLLFGHKWRNLDTLLFFLHCVGECSCVVNWQEYYHLWVKFEVVVSSYCTFTETFEILFQNWIKHKWREFGVFLLDCASFRRCHNCMDRNQQEMLALVSPLRTSSLFFRWLVGGIYWSIFQLCSYFLAIGFSDINWWALLVQYNFISYGFTFSNPFFVQVDEFFFIASENQVSLFNFFSLFFAFSCSISFTAVVVSGIKIMEPIYAPTRWWPCLSSNCVSGLRSRERTWTFVDAFKSRTWCSSVLRT